MRAGEVILCGGAINSPQLLQLSGVGNAHELEAIDVSVVHDLPAVGENLQDHLEVYVQHAATQPVSVQPALKKWRRPEIGARWLFLRSGPGATNHFEAGGFVRSNDEVAYPNLMFHFLPLAIRYDGSQPAAKHGYQVHVGPMYSDVRGSVKITSADPRVHPALRFNYLSTPNDRREWIEAIHVARSILEQPAFAPYDGGETRRAPSVQSDEEILDWVARDAETALHPSCTCAMGTVVDPATMRVYGLDGIRVVDASVFPFVPNGNIYAPVMMVAEKAADLIRGVTPLEPLRLDFYRPMLSQLRVDELLAAIGERTPAPASRCGHRADRRPRGRPRRAVRPLRRRRGRRRARARARGRARRSWATQDAAAYAAFMADRNEETRAETVRVPEEIARRADEVVELALRAADEAEHERRRRRQSLRRARARRGQRGPRPGRASIARDLELAPEVEAGDLLEHVRRHRLPPLRLDLRAPVRVARLRRVPDGDADDLVPVGRDELVRPQHPLGKLARPPGAAELFVRARLELPGRDPDVPAVELHAAQSRKKRIKSRASLADSLSVFGVCRYCGDELDRPRRPLEACARCENSPLCDRCGHPRSDHTRVFARRSRKGCTRIVGDFQTLRSWPCDCEGFRPIEGRLAEADFAASQVRATELPALRRARSSG